MSHNRVATGSLVVMSFIILGGCGLSDGPMGPIPGGPLSAGALVTEPDINWSQAIGQAEGLFIELQLVEPPRSRTTAAMLYQGKLYVPCDLGFLWTRVPAPARWMLHLIYVLKDWHEDAVRDGRVVLRIEGKRYERQAVRETDPDIIAALRSEMESGAGEFFGAPLRNAPLEGPNDVWFFRMDPRLERVAVQMR